MKGIIKNLLELLTAMYDVSYNFPFFFFHRALIEDIINKPILVDYSIILVIRVNIYRGYGYGL